MNIYKKTIDIININNIIKKHTNKVEGNCLYRNDSNFIPFEEGQRYDNKLILRNNFYNIEKVHDDEKCIKYYDLIFSEYLK